MKISVKPYNDYSVTEEQIKRYQEMPIEKRLERLYLGNLLRKVFSEKMFNVQDKIRGRKI
jgi:hypothetical protein